MASIKCMHGGVEHRHESVQAVRECVGAVAAYIDQPFLEPDYKSPERQAAATSTDVRAREPGIYLLDGNYYKVQQNREHTRSYAKRGVRTTEWVMDDKKGEQVSKVKWHWEYDRGAIYSLRASHLLTHEQATEFGKLWSVCCNCFLELTHEESMDRGYGPKCAENYGWPYDHSRK